MREISTFGRFCTPVSSDGALRQFGSSFPALRSWDGLVLNRRVSNALLPTLVPFASSNLLGIDAHTCNSFCDVSTVKNTARKPIVGTSRPLQHQALCAHTQILHDESGMFPTAWEAKLRPASARGDSCWSAPRHIHREQLPRTRATVLSMTMRSYKSCIFCRCSLKWMVVRIQFWLRATSDQKYTRARDYSIETIRKTNCLHKNMRASCLELCWSLQEPDQPEYLVLTFAQVFLLQDFPV